MLQQMLVDNAINVGLGPALVAALAALIAWKPWSETSELAGGFWAGPIALAGAYLTGSYLINGMPEIAPTGDGGWLIHLTVLAAGLGLWESLYRRNRWWLWGAKALLLGAGLYVTVNFMYANVWESVAVELSYSVGIVGLGILSMWTLEKMARRHPGATMPIVMHIMVTGAALVITFAGSASTGQQLGTLATATAVFVAISWWKGPARVTLARGGMTVFATIVTLKLAIGYFNIYDPSLYASITTPAIVASPLVLWIGEFPPISSLTGWRATAARAALMASGVAAIVGASFVGW